MAAIPGAVPAGCYVFKTLTDNTGLIEIFLNPLPMQYSIYIVGYQ